MPATIYFYEGSYQFDCIKTDLRVTTEFIAFKLQKALENREPKETLWAELNDNGVMSRFTADSEGVVYQYVFVNKFGDNVRKKVVSESTTHFLLEDGTIKEKSHENTKKLSQAKKVNEIVDKALVAALKKAHKETEMPNSEIYEAVLNRLQSLSKNIEGNVNKETHLSNLLFGF